MSIEINQETLFKNANDRWLMLLDLDDKNELAVSQLSSNYLSDRNDSAAAVFLDRYEHLPTIERLDLLYELKARLATQRDNHSDAIQNWYNAKQHGADTDKCDFFIVKHALKIDDLKTAKSIINNFDSRMRLSDYGRISVAKVYMYELKWSEAIEALVDIDSFKQYKDIAIDHLYKCYMNDFRHDSALILCNSLDPVLHPEKPFRLGKLQYRMTKFKDAIDSFTQGMNGKDHASSKVWLIKTLYSADEKNSASAQAEVMSSLTSTDSLTRARCWEAAGKLALAESCFRRAAYANEDKTALASLVSFLVRYRYWGKAYRSLRSAVEYDLATDEMHSMLQTIETACKATNTSLPNTEHDLQAFDFRSSEAMVTSIVDRLLSKAQPERLPTPIAKSGGSKIALIINSLGPGGAERQVVNLANGLVKAKDNVFLLCTYLSRLEQDCFYQSEVDKDVSVSEYYVRTEHLSANDIPELAEYSDLIEHIQPVSRQQLILHLCKKLIEIRPDVVHGWLDETLINTVLACRMLNIPVVAGRWGSMPPGVNRTVTERDQNNIDYLEHAYQQIGRLPGLKLSSNSRLTGDAYAEMMKIDPAEISIVYNGVDAKKLERDVQDAPLLRESLGIPEDSAIVGTVFRISEEKRPMLWIDIAQKLASSNPSTHFIVVGAGPLASHVEAYAESLEIKNIHFVGKQSNVGAWLSIFDIFLLTSRVEGVSNAVLEAQFCSCPVIAPNVGGLSEAMQHEVTGMLLDDHSVESFASAVQSVLEHPEKMDLLRNNARCFAVKTFSIDTMVKNYRTLFFAKSKQTHKCLHAA